MKNYLLSFLSAALLILRTLSLASGATEAGGTLYLDNSIGSDSFDGSSPTRGEGSVGPIASITRAGKLLKESGTLIIKNTGVPYRPSLILAGKGGTIEHPLVIEGNGATLEGLEVSKPSDWTVEHDDIISMMWPGMPYGFFVVADGAPAVLATSLQEIQPGETYYDKPQGGKHKGYYRLPRGKRLEDLKLEVPTGGCGCGLQIISASNIIVRNLKCRYFCNDGFNLQGECEGLRFEHIEGYLNGDQGFSAHGTVTSMVVDGNFHNNDSGIADTSFSRTTFYGVTVAGNRSWGVRFMGGEHSIVNGRITDKSNPIILEPALGLDALPGTPFNPYSSCRLFLRNTCVEGGDFGMRIRSSASAEVNYCVFRGQPTSLIIVDDEARLHMTNSIIAPRAGGKVLDSSSMGTYWGDYNCWASHYAQTNDHGFDILDVEPHSIVADPLFQTDKGPALQPSSPARNKAFVDLTFLPWLQHSNILDPKFPPQHYPLRYPDLYPDIGCQLP